MREPERARESQTQVEMQRENQKPHGASVPHLRGPVGLGRSARLGPGIWMALAHAEGGKGRHGTA